MLKLSPVSSIKSQKLVLHKTWKKIEGPTSNRKSCSKPQDEGYLTGCNIWFQLTIIQSADWKWNPDPFHFIIYSFIIIFETRITQLVLYQVHSLKSNLCVIFSPSRRWLHFMVDMGSLFKFLWRWNKNKTKNMYKSFATIWWEKLWRCYTGTGEL